MNPAEVVRRRLHAQRLRGPGLASAEDAVRHLLAVQAQEFPYARWSLAQRTGFSGAASGAASHRVAAAAEVATATEVEQSVSDGHILRTHILRPTWHFVHRADLRWLTALSAPRLHQGNAGMYRRTGIDAAAAGRSGQVLAEAVRGGHHLTREQLAARLRDEGFAATGFGLAYVIMHAEISGILASGSPVRSPGSALKHTYALFDERVPPGPALPPTRAEALSELVRRYFTSRGPATVKDCADWSGLTMADVRLGLQQCLAAAPETLATSVIDGVVHYFDAGADGSGGAGPASGPRLDLIQCYDEYVMGYSATRHYLGGSAPAFPVAGAPMHVVLLDGRMAGSWRHTMSAGRCELDIRLFAAAGPALDDAAQDAVDRYGAYLGIPAARVGSGAKLEGHI
ncbi:winged helix DNA-binding domain-containing protein [Pseudarthrobacter psychrotolerans]|uniref:Winged helix DNA-binding domain-containing protein n=1 Tax=Pseudarthrobacter psychrotolerans TaxID=2697569 RepID=A0A6P1NU49_9MICC|nr:winged helix DNA-binding domain-containing protein [Pseudarthrobacter psychrotolerans]QHK22084.1 winged helix DNA-binding domain-containing protein [Pseudarthrobacter psychrotolerans]